MTDTDPAGKKFFDQISGIQDAQDCKVLYDEWAASYDKDLLDPSQDYVAPTMVARAVLAANGNIEGLILDAGCGTGLSGIALSQAGAKTIDGVDLSDGMIQLAEKTGVYRNLATADLTKPLIRPDNTYDIVTCVGTLTKHHVGPVPALREFVRILKSGGLLAATVRDDIWELDGYKAEIDRLASENVEIVSTERADYRKALGVKSRLVVLRKR